MVMKIQVMVFWVVTLCIDMFNVLPCAHLVSHFRRLQPQSHIAACQQFVAYCWLMCCWITAMELKICNCECMMYFVLQYIPGGAQWDFQHCLVTFFTRIW